MANGGDGVIPISPRPRAQQPSGEGARSDAAWLPLDIVIAEIATRSDPATLVRCAATCRAARRRISEDANLLLRDTGLFLPPLLRGHLVGFTSYDYEGGRVKTDVYLVDTSTAADGDAPHLVEATFASDAAEAEALMDPVPVDSRGGLVLVRATATQRHDTLFVCNPATGRRLVLPPEPEPFPNGGVILEERYDILLVGDRDDGASVGRPFQVVKVKLVLSNRRLMVQTFSSEHGSWSPRTAEIPTPNIHGRSITVTPNILVVGDVVHWLCITEVRSYLLMLHVREARVSETALPATFPRPDTPGIRSYLLATDSAGGSPVVLVADEENNIRAWEQCNKHTHTKSKMWKAWPRVVTDREAILGFNDEMKEVVQRCNDEVARRWMDRSWLALELLWFGERSGVVLLRTHKCLLWLDLQSKKIIRCLCSDDGGKNDAYRYKV